MSKGGVAPGFMTSARRCRKEAELPETSAACVLRRQDYDGTAHPSLPTRRWLMLRDGRGGGQAGVRRGAAVCSRGGVCFLRRPTRHGYSRGLITVVCKTYNRELCTACRSLRGVWRFCGFPTQNT